MNPAIAGYAVGEALTGIYISPICEVRRRVALNSAAGACELRLLPSFNRAAGCFGCDERTTKRNVQIGRGCRRGMRCNFLQCTTAAAVTSKMPDRTE